MLILTNIFQVYLVWPVAS